MTSLNILKISLMNLRNSNRMRLTTYKNNSLFFQIYLKEEIIITSNTLDKYFLLRVLLNASGIARLINK